MHLSDRVDVGMSVRRVLILIPLFVLAIPDRLVAEQQVPKSKTDQRPAAPDPGKMKDQNDTASTDQSKPPKRKISGRIVDEDDKPIEGAALVWQVSYSSPNVTVETTSDQQGRFICSTPDLPPSSLYRQADQLWVYKKGKQLTTASTHRTGNEDQKLSDLNIQLVNDTPGTFTVLSTDGTPIPNVKVEPWHYLSSNGAYGIVPDSLCRLMAATTDEEGHVQVSSFDRQKMLNLHASSTELGTQEIRIPSGAPGMDVHNLVMRSVGQVKGHLTADDPARFKGLELYLTSAQDLNSGVARVQVDEDGNFEVPAMATGELQVEMQEPSVDATSLPRIPERMLVLEGQTLDFEIHFEPSILVEGAIVTKDKEAPVPGAEISIGYGTWRQSALVRSDADGRYKARVLAGSVRTHVVMMPKEFVNYQQIGEPWNERIQVPDDSDTPFQLPTVRLEKLIEVKGTVILSDGKLAKKAQMFGQAGNRRYGFCQTNDDGEFTMLLPESVSLDKIRIRLEGEPESRDCEIVKTKPLTLQVQ